MILIRKFYNASENESASSSQGVPAETAANIEQAKSNITAMLMGENANQEISPEQQRQAEIDNEALKLVEKRAAEIEAQQKEEQEKLRKEQQAIIEKKDSPIKVTKAAESKEVKLDAEIEQPNNTDEVSEEDLLKLLSKKANREIKSLDEFLSPKSELTEQEKQALAEERESKKLAYGLQNNKITNKEIESYIADTKDYNKVAFEVFFNNARLANPEITEESAMELFEDSFNLKEGEDSELYKIGQNQIKFLAENQIAKKHSKYLQLDTIFDEYEESQNIIKQRQEAILKKAPQFKKDVEDVLQKIKTVNIAGYNLEFEDDILDACKDEVFSEGSAQYTQSIIEKGYSLAELERAFADRVFIQNKDLIIEKILEADRLKHQAGVRGIAPKKNISLMQSYADSSDRKGIAADDIRDRLGVTTNPKDN